VDPGLDAQLRGAVVHRLQDPAHEVLAVVLVGVGGALALPEAAERAADDADVGDVDVAVDDEGHLVARELGAQLVRGLAQVGDGLRAGLGEQGGELVLRQLEALAAAGDRPRDEVAVDRPVVAPARTRGAG
jgi:hypothetical protein